MKFEFRLNYNIVHFQHVFNDIRSSLINTVLGKKDKILSYFIYKHDFNIEWAMSDVGYDFLPGNSQ